MIDLNGHVWRVVTRSKRDTIAHLIPSHREHGAKAVCGEPVDPRHATHAGTLVCFKCKRIARERQEAA